MCELELSSLSHYPADNTFLLIHDYVGRNLMYYLLTLILVWLALTNSTIRICINYSSYSDILCICMWIRISIYTNIYIYIYIYMYVNIWEYANPCKLTFAWWIFSLGFRVYVRKVKKYFCKRKWRIVTHIVEKCKKIYCTVES